MEPTVLRMKYHIAADHPNFDGHFPGAPVFPAVSQIDLVVDALRKHIDPRIHSACVKRAKFRALLGPDTDVELELTLAAENSVRWSLEGQGLVFSAGELSYSLAK